RDRERRVVGRDVAVGGAGEQEAAVGGGLGGGRGEGTLADRGLGRQRGGERQGGLVGIEDRLRGAGPCESAVLGPRETRGGGPPASRRTAGRSGRNRASPAGCWP